MERAVNAAGIRFHVKPPVGFLLAQCDELELMVEPETPLWQAPPSVSTSTETRTILMPWLYRGLFRGPCTTFWATGLPAIAAYFSLRHSTESLR